MAAAEEVGRRVGLARVTTKEVAAAAECSEASIYYHFENRNDLLAELVARRFAELNDRMAGFQLTPGDPPAERLTELVTVVMEAFVELIGLSAPLFADPDVLGQFREVLIKRSISPHGIQATVASRLADQQRQGHLRDDVDTDVLALLLVGACHELALEAHLMGTAESSTPGAVAQEIGTTFATLLTRR
jgi:AcrR family transcriptional regulator